MLLIRDDKGNSFWKRVYFFENFFQENREMLAQTR